MIESVLATPGSGMTLSRSSYRFFCVVAVCQSTGAWGVGFCPCVALHQLQGFSGLGDIDFFEVSDTSFSVFQSECGFTVPEGKRLSFRTNTPPRCAETQSRASGGLRLK